LRVNADVEDLLVELELANRKAKTIKDYEDILRLFFRVVNKKCVKDVTSSDMKRFLLETKRKRKWSHNTYFIYISKLRTFFRRRNREIYDFLMGISIKPKKREKEPFMKAEMLAIANYFKKRRATGVYMGKLYYTLALFHPAIGGRIGEICKLNISDLRDDPDGILVHFRAETTKTEKGRKVLLRKDSLAYPAIVDYLRSREEANNAPLFVNRFGRRLRPSSVERKYRMARRALGIKKICTPHINRHTYDNTFRRAGVDLATIAALTGHSVKTLLTTYSFVSEEDKREAIKKVKII